MRRCASALLAAIACSNLIAEDGDLPLGTIVASADGQVVVDIATDRLVADDMLAVYGPGTVEKHPLTGEVTVEHRRQVAKAQVLHVAGQRITARITWLADEVVIEPGFDAVPLPGEASPDAPPVLSVPTVDGVSVAAQGRLRLRVPVIDPEGGPLATTWRLSGPAGASGVLAAASGGSTEVEWLAPAREGSVDVVLTAYDASGQPLEVTLPVTVGPLADNWRQRDYQSLAVQGGAGDPAEWLSRGPDGRWWLIADGEVQVADAGWKQVRPIAVQDSVRLGDINAVVPGVGSVAVLDGGAKTVFVLAEDGVVRAGMSAGLVAPTDLAGTPDGAFAIADQRAGGVMILEPSGAVRGRLGFADDDATDGFRSLTRVAAGPDGTVYALDIETLVVQRFDRHHRRLASWNVAGANDGDQAPVDLAWHSQGLLVLLADGTILVFDHQGSPGRAWQSVAETGWFDDVDAPTSIDVDGLGSIVVTYPRPGIIARYNSSGAITGVRGNSLWALDRFVTDGAGTIIGLDEDAAQVSVFDADGWLVRRFGSSERDGGPFDEPGRMAVSPDGRYLSIVDEGRIAIIRYDLTRPNDRPLVFGQRGDNNGQFEEPTDITIDEAGRTYVLDPDLHRVVVFDVDGRFVMNIGRYDRGRSEDEVDDPKLIAVHPDGSALYIYDDDRYEIMKFELDHAGGAWRHIANGGGRGSDAGQMSRPVGLGVDRNGLVYLADSSREDLQVLDFRATNLVPVVQLDLEAAGLSRVTDMTLDPDGRAWVLDRGRIFGFAW